MNINDLNFLAECNACEGSGNIQGYSENECPACGGDGRLNRVEDAPDGCIRLYEEYHRSSGYVTHEDIPITDDETEVGGFIQLYGDDSLQEILGRLRDEGDEYTLSIFHNLLRDSNSPFDQRDFDF